jgi:magnesium-transporting ATPase (P-type)
MKTTLARPGTTTAAREAGSHRSRRDRKPVRRREDDVWHQLHGDEALRLLEVDSRIGLTAEEASRRQAKFGFNTLTQRPPPPAWRRLLRQFNQPLVYLLLVAVVVAAALGEGVASAVFVIVEVEKWIRYGRGRGDHALPE